MSDQKAFTESMAAKRAQDDPGLRSRSRSTSPSSSSSTSSTSSTPDLLSSANSSLSVSTFSSRSSPSPSSSSSSSNEMSSSSSSNSRPASPLVQGPTQQQELPEVLDPEVNARIERTRRRLGPMRPDLEFEVERILDMREGRNGALSYLVRWRGYSPSEDSWERERNLRCEDLLEEFYKSRQSRRQ